VGCRARARSFELYARGSTGVPRGVQIPHVTNLSHLASIRRLLYTRVAKLRVTAVRRTLGACRWGCIGDPCAATGRRRFARPTVSEAPVTFMNFATRRHWSRSVGDVADVAVTAAAAGLMTSRTDVRGLNGLEGHTLNNDRTTEGSARDGGDASVEDSDKHYTYRMSMDSYKQYVLDSGT